jgi:hypothetical protein
MLQTHKWGKGNYIENCIITERTIWPKQGILKLRRIRKEYERVRCLLFLHDENAKQFISDF